MKRFLLIAAALVWSLSLLAQNRLGMTSGNYAGINSIHLNPSALINSEYFLDVNIAGGGVFVLNNYMFLRKEDYSIGSLLFQVPEFKTFTGEMGDDRYVDAWDAKELKHGFANAQIFGPSAMLTVGKNSFGFSTGFRSLINVKDFSYDVAKNAYEGLDYPPFHGEVFNHSRDMHLEAVQFSEIALSYSRNVYTRNYDKVDVGISFKYLIPHNALKLHIDNIEYMMPNSDTMEIYDLNADLRMASPVNYNNLNIPDGGGWIKGGGFAVDLGVTYTKTKKLQRSYQRFTRLCHQKQPAYHYRIGLSVLDLGSITLRNNVQSHRYRDVEAVWPDVGSFDYESVNQALQEVSSQLLGSPGASLSDETRFSMGLPTAVSLQADYHYLQNWYLHSTLIYGLQGGASGFNRASYFAVMPRWESALFGAGLPVSMHRFRQPQVGLNLRVANLTVGTSNLSHYLGLAELNGVDFYFSLKFSLRKGNCRGASKAGCRGQEYGLSRN